MSFCNREITVMLCITLAGTAVKTIAFCTVAFVFTSAYTRDLAVQPIPLTTSFPWEITGYSHSKPEKQFCVSDNRKRMLK